MTKFIMVGHAARGYSVLGDLNGNVIKATEIVQRLDDWGYQAT